MEKFTSAKPTTYLTGYINITIRPTLSPERRSGFADPGSWFTPKPRHPAPVR
jgi:hypothetical protein